MEGRGQRSGAFAKPLLMLARRIGESMSGLLLGEHLWLGVHLGEETTNTS